MGQKLSYSGRIQELMLGVGRVCMSASSKIDLRGYFGDVGNYIRDIRISWLRKSYLKYLDEQHIREKVTLALSKS